MARQKGIIRIKGSLGGITFYQQEGDNFSRVTNGPSKEKIANDPAFKRTRENNSEFAGATIAGKGMRIGLQTFIQEMSDSRVTSSLMKVFRTMITRATTGNRGQRPITVLPNKDLLVGFNFNNAVHLDSVFQAPFTAVANAGRNAVTITIPDFNTANAIHALSGTTYFKMVGTASVLSSYIFNATTKKYEASDLANNTLNASAVSALIPIGANVGSIITLAPTITPAPVMVATSGLVACLGIEFYQLVNGFPYLLAASNCMKVVNVF
jgi:hypothetical protein